LSNFGNVSKEFHTNFSILKEKQDDCIGTGSLCVKEEFFRQATNVTMFLNESKQSTPLGIIVNTLKTYLYIVYLGIFHLLNNIFKRRYT
jgi:hypothetical protein